MVEATQPHPPRKTNVKETISSLTIAFALAFVFRGFVIEGFVIPTGSMAPTLLGAHMRLQSPQTGYDWAVGPWNYASDQRTPMPIQGTLDQPIAATDPMSGLRIGQSGGLDAKIGTQVPLRGGDRIFVLKYLHGLFDPARFDSVVFKYPGEPRENYIKRLVGLPNEEVALVDGDIFRRDIAPLTNGQSDWTASGWSVVRKGEREQRTLWMPLYDSHFAPPNLEEDRRGFQAPWLGQTPDGQRDRNWTIGNASSYVYEGQSATTLAWDTQSRPISDFYAYNDIRIDAGREWGIYGVSRSGGQSRLFPVADVRASFNIQPQAPGANVAMALDARKHNFRAEIMGTTVRVRMKPQESEQWTELATAQLDAALSENHPTRVEFWHADQTLSVWIDGDLIVEGSYDWTPAQRIAYSTTIDPATLAYDPMPTTGNPLSDGAVYIRPSLRLEFEGGAFTLHRVRLDRDLHYQATEFLTPRHTRYGQPALATHPQQPCVLKDKQYFLCGDNSASSLDGRLWDVPNPWIELNLGDGTPGVVHQDLIIGRAFFVYFPAFNRERGFPIPDLGRVRWIW